MTTISIPAPYPVFADIDGQPLEDGYIWIGVSGLEPQANPQTAYWDAALTQVATQPVRTRGGYPLNGTAIGQLFIGGVYSIKVQNKNSSTVVLDLTGAAGAAGAGVGSISFGTTGLTPSAPTDGDVVVGGTLAVANGGTGVTTSTGTGSVVRATNPVLTTPNLGTPSAVTLTNATGLPLATGVTGTLPVAKGGTGLSSLTANSVPFADGAGALTSSANLTFADSTLSVNGVLVGKGAGAISNNTAIGATSLDTNTTGSANTAIGSAALTANTTGSSNTAVGSGAMAANTTGAENSAFGRAALTTNVNGVGNSTFGDFSLRLCLSGSTNSAFGAAALTAVTTSSSNVGFGAFAGFSITTGARNTIVGTSCDASAATGNDQIVVGYSLTGKGNDTAFIGGTNGAYNEKNVTTWETTSDRRIKRNIEDNHQGLEVIERIRVRNFEYRLPDELDPTLPMSAAINKPGLQLGVIAQEIQEVLPACVTTNSTGVLSVSTDPLVWYLVNAVKQLASRVNELEAKQ